MQLDWTVGKYKEFEIFQDREIGKGNFGKVYHCENKLNKQLSLCAKVILMFENEKNQQREKEITELISKNQGNPNIVQIHHVEVKYQKMIFIMEKCDSNFQQLINEKIARNEKFNQAEIDDFLKQFLTGYLFLYNNNIVHRDIKPENILIKYQSGNKTNPIYKISDFGVGKIYKVNEFKMTKTGTPVFSAPEINVIYQDKDLEQKFLFFSKQEKAKNCVDIFSLGIILYNLVYGDYPFVPQQNNIQEFFNTIKTTPLNTPNNYYKAMIEGMLKYYPDQRITFKQLFDRYNIRFQSNQNNIQNPNFQNPNAIINQNAFQNQSQYQFGNQNQNPTGNQAFNVTFFPNNAFQQNQQTLQQINQNGAEKFNTNILPQPNQIFYQQVGQNFRSTNPIINFRQCILDYFKLLLLENEKILAEEFKQVISKITTPELITQPIIGYLKQLYFPLKPASDFYRQEYVQFLFSISQLSKSYFISQKSTNLVEMKKYLKENPN